MTADAVEVLHLLSQSICVIFSGMSLLPPNWLASGIFIIEYQ